MRTLKGTLRGEKDYEISGVAKVKMPKYYADLMHLRLNDD